MATPTGNHRRNTLTDSSQQGQPKRTGSVSIGVLIAILLLLPLASCTLFVPPAPGVTITPSPLPTIPTQTPFPTFNLTPSNQEEATLFPIIATSTAEAQSFALTSAARVENIQQTLAPQMATAQADVNNEHTTATARAVILQSTVQPAITTATARAPTSVFLNEPGGQFSFRSAINLALWFLFWSIPGAFIIGYVWLAARGSHPLDEKAFIAFIIAPGFLRQIDPAHASTDSSRNRFMTEFREWTPPAVVNQFITGGLFALVTIAFCIIFWPLKDLIFTRLWVVSLSEVLILILLIPVFQLLRFAGQVFGYSWYAALTVLKKGSLRAPRHFVELWSAVLHSWGIGLIPILYGLIAPLPGAYKIFLIVSALLYLFLLWLGFFYVAEGGALIAPFLIPGVILQAAVQKLLDFWYSAYRNRGSQRVWVDLPAQPFSLVNITIAIAISLAISTESFPFLLLGRGTLPAMLENPLLKNAWWLKAIMSFKDHFLPYRFLFGNPARLESGWLNTPIQNLLRVFLPEGSAGLPMPNGVEPGITPASLISAAAALFVPVLLILAPLLIAEAMAAFLKAKSRLEVHSSVSQEPITERIVFHIFSILYAVLFWQAILAAGLEAASVNSLPFDLLLYIGMLFYGIGYLLIWIRHDLGEGLGWRWLLTPIYFFDEFLFTPLLSVTMSFIVLLILLLPLASLGVAIMASLVPSDILPYPRLTGFLERLVFFKEGIWTWQFFSIDWLTAAWLLVICAWLALAAYTFSRLRSTTPQDVPTALAISMSVCVISFMAGVTITALLTVVLALAAPILPDLTIAASLVSAITSLAVPIIFLMTVMEFLKIPIYSVPAFLIAPFVWLYRGLFYLRRGRLLPRARANTRYRPFEELRRRYSSSFYPELFRIIAAVLGLGFSYSYVPRGNLERPASSPLSQPIGGGFVLLQALAYLLTDLILSAILRTRLFGLYIPVSSNATFSVVGNAFFLLINAIYVAFLLLFIAFHFRASSKKSVLPLYDTFFHQAFALVFAFALAHLFLLPLNAFWYGFARSRSDFEMHRLIYFAFQTLIVFGFYVHLTWDVYKDRFLPVLSDIRSSIATFRVQYKHKLRLFFQFIRSLVRSVLSPVNVNFLSRSGWLWLGVMLYITSFLIAAGALLIKAINNPSSPARPELLLEWTSRTLGLLAGAPFIGLLALHPVHVFFFRVSDNLQYQLGKFLNFFEGSNRVTLLSVPARWLRNLLLSRWTLYPGYRQIFIHLVISILLINGFLGLILHPLEALLGDLFFPTQYWRIIEILLSISMGCLFAANFVRAVPLAMLLGGLVWSVGLLALPVSLTVLMQALFMILVGIFLLAPFIEGFFLNNIRGQSTGLRVSLDLLSERFSDLQGLAEILDERYDIFESTMGVDRFLLIYEQEDCDRVRDGFLNTLRLINQDRATWQSNSPDPIVQMLRLILRTMPQLGMELLEMIIFSPEKLQLSSPMLREAQQAAVKVQLMEERFSRDDQTRILLQLRRLGIFQIADSSSERNSYRYFLSAPRGVPAIDVETDDSGDWYDENMALLFETYTSLEPDIDRIREYWHSAGTENPQAREAIAVYNALQKLQGAQSVEEIAALNYDPSVFQINLNYLDDLAKGFSELANVSESLTRAETLGGRRDQLDVYRAADYRLRRSLDEIAYSAFDPERQLLQAIVRHWQDILSTHIQNLTPTASVTASLASTEIFWAPTERIALIIKNSAEGPAFDLKIKILPGDGYRVIDPPGPEGIVSVESIQSSAAIPVEFGLEFLRQDLVEIAYEVTFTDSTLTPKIFPDRQVLRFRQAADEGFPDVQNPYHIGTPVEDPQLFVGRDEIFESIEQTLVPQGRASIILMYGQRRTGKTSIIKQLVRRYRDHSDFWPIYLDLQSIDMYDPRGDAQRFFAWMMNDIKWDMKDFPGGDPLKTPTTNGENKDYFSILRHDFLAQVDRLLASRGKTLLLIFDEFDTLRNFFDPDVIENILWNLRGLVFERPRGGVILIGTPTLKEMASSTKQTPFFGSISKIIQVGPLDDEAARKLINKPVESVLNYSPNAVEKILKLSGNNAQIIQTICQEIFKLAKERSQRAVGLGMVEEAIKESLNQLTALSGWWLEFSREEKAVVSALAHILSDETAFASAPRITREIESYSIKLDGMPLDISIVQKSLEKLEAWQMIDKRADTYKFSIDLFRLWVRTGKPPGIVKTEIAKEQGGTL